MVRLFLTLALALLPASALAQATPASPLVNRDLIAQAFAELDALKAQLDQCPGCQQAPLPVFAPRPLPRGDGGAAKKKLEIRIAELEAQVRASCLGATDMAVVQACLNNNRAGLDQMRGANVVGLMALAPQGRAGKVQYSVGATAPTPGAFFMVDSTPSPGDTVLEAFKASVQTSTEPVADQPMSKTAKVALTAIAGLIAGGGTGYFIGKDAEYGTDQAGDRIEVRESTRLPYTLAGAGIGAGLGTIVGVLAF